MTPNQLIKQIKKSGPEPVYFLYGEERYYHVEIVRELTRILVTPDKEEFNRETFEARISNAEDWIASANTFSFFGGRKLVVVWNLDDRSIRAEETESLLNYLKNPAPETCLVLTSEKVDRKRKLDKALCGLKSAVECASPDERSLSDWLQNRASALGYELSSSSARLMVERIGPKPGILNSELEKAITYAGESKKISEPEVEQMVGVLQLKNIFQLTDAIKARNTEAALRLLANQFHHGEEPLKIFGAITWQFRFIWELRLHLSRQIGPEQIAQAMGSRLFLIKKAVPYAKAFKTEQLRRAFDYLFRADLDLKSSGQSPERIMERLILNLCSTG